MEMEGTGTAPPAPPGQSPSSQAMTALVFAVLGLTCCQLLSPIAWYLGAQEKRAIREGRSPAAGQAIANVAVLLGIAGVVLFGMVVLWITFWGGMAVLGAFIKAASSR